MCADFSVKRDFRQSFQKYSPYRKESADHLQPSKTVALTNSTHPKQKSWTPTKKPCDITLADFIILKEQYSEPKKPPAKKVDSKVVQSKFVSKRPIEKPSRPQKFKREILQERNLRNTVFADKEAGGVESFENSDKLAGCSDEYKSAYMKVAESAEAQAYYHATHSTGEKQHEVLVREYVTHPLTPELNQKVKVLLEMISNFQMNIEPTKLRQQRRFVLGLNEIRKFLTLKKVKAVICAPNLEPTLLTGGVDALHDKIKEECSNQQVPLIYALSRNGLRRALADSARNFRHSSVGILNTSGADKAFQDMLATFAALNNVS